MGHLVTVATCNLNQWALDFAGNRARIKASIREAKRRGATIRVGPELEITGYGCYDHFLESDTNLHAWESVVDIVRDPECQDILLDIGSPVVHRNVLYNCRIIALNGKILLIRPKLVLANDGNYREERWFTGWSRPGYVESYYLPRLVQKHQGAMTVPFGDCIISTPDTCFAAETCEEIFAPNSPHVNLGLNGVEIFTNSSGSHHQLRKLDQRLNLIINATQKNGGIYLYANQQGCDGDRLYYDGCALIVVNGEIVAQGSQFGLKDVEVVTATCDLEAVRAKRLFSSRGQQAIQAPAYQRIEIDFPLSKDNLDLSVSPSPSRPVFYHKPEEEIALGPAAWMWDYLRRSRAAGFLLPLSGGIDSCSTAAIGFSMARMVYQAIKDGNETVLADCRRIAGAYEDEDWVPPSPQAIMKNMFHTVYMGMKTQSSSETRKRAKDLAEAIGSYHIEADIDRAFDAFSTIYSTATDHKPKFGVHGGTDIENLALQNIQSRSRMVLAYEFAQLLPSSRGRPGGGGLLVLGSANVDESLRGYFTKYDNSSADINPIGSISKVDLRRFINWARDAFELPVLQEFLDATPTAELVPIENGSIQLDEVEMGLTYEELSALGRLRKNKLGAYGMFETLLHEWHDKYSAKEIADKVKHFHHYYAINRHKMTTLTPSYHAEAYSPDDNRFDLRPFNYPSYWGSEGFQKIDEALSRIPKEDREKKGASS